MDVYEGISGTDDFCGETWLSLTYAAYGMRGFLILVIKPYIIRVFVMDEGVVTCAVLL